MIGFGRSWRAARQERLASPLPYIVDINAQLVAAAVDAVVFIAHFSCESKSPIVARPAKIKLK
jgi:hypothetical protein